MTEPEARYPCPVCLGIKLQKIRLAPDSPLLLDYCNRCGGMWFDKGEVQQLQHFSPQVAQKSITLRAEIFLMRCHSCHHLMDRNAERCPTCLWRNVIHCPVCDLRMKRRTFQELVLDVCFSCQGVWFDQIELAQLWNLNLEKWRRLKSRSEKPAADSYDVADGFLDVFVPTPDILGCDPGVLAEAGHTVLETSGEILSQAPEAAGIVLEGAGGALEGVGELAGGVFEVIVSILGDLF